MSNKSGLSNNCQIDPLRAKAELLHHERGGVFAGRQYEDVQALLNELELHLVELELQNNQLRDALFNVANSRGLYSDLYEYAPVGYVTLGADDKILDINIKAAEILGRTRCQLLGTSLSDYVEAESKGNYHQYTHRAFLEKTKVCCELTFTKLDMSKLLVDLEIVALGCGTDSLLRVAITDVSARRKTEEKLEQLNHALEMGISKQKCEAKLLAEAISHLGEGVMITSYHSDWDRPRIVFVNQALCNITGFSYEELIGKSPEFLQQDQVPRDVINRFKDELSNGRSCQMEVKGRRPDGSVYEVELFISPLVSNEEGYTTLFSIHRDITERKLTEKRLTDSQERFRMLVDATSEVIYSMSPDWGVMRSLHGRGILVDTDRPNVDWLSHYIPTDYHPLVLSRVRAAIRSQSVFELEHPFLYKDGTVGWLYSRAIPVFGRDGSIVEWFGAASDITLRKNAENALREREERLQAILNTASDAIINFDHRGIITKANVATSSLFLYTNAELQGMNIKQLMPGLCRHGARKEAMGERVHGRSIGTEHCKILELAALKKDATVFPTAVSISEVDHLGLFTVIVRDISDVKALQRDVLIATDEEQARIGQDLHDGAQQELVGTGMLAELLLKKLKKLSSSLTECDRAKVVHLCERIVNGIDRAHEEIHSVARGLDPLRMNKIGLVESLRQLAARANDLEGISCRFVCIRPELVRDDWTASHLYRISQEAVTNAMKHSQASQIVIELDYSLSTSVLRIVDNGRGFGSSKTPSGMGLTTMFYRASMIGAVVTIEHGNGSGTIVECKLIGGGGDHERKTIR